MRGRLSSIIVAAGLLLVLLGTLSVPVGPRSAGAPAGPADPPSASLVGPSGSRVGLPARHPAPRTMTPATTRRVTGAARSSAAGSRFRDQPLADVPGIRALPDPPPDRWSVRAAGPVAATAGSPGIAAAGRAAPWSPPHLLADPTGMNDQHLALAASPATGHLFGVWEATDLGGSDRDIHLGWSTDGGATWQQRELHPSSLDEYQPDLAIDQAGYLHVVWARADGALVRARSAGPEDVQNWAFARVFTVGEPVAVPSIAVSGSGDYARVFIACSWYTVNWNWYQAEYTLLWLYSTSGGQTVSYQYLEPDGHPDLWPDVALQGATVFMVNGEQDPYTGRTRILAAADALSGSFVQYLDLSASTPMSCGFPSVAADAQGVYLAWQLDWDDGLGNVDGDIMYAVSRDGLATADGPYAMQATLTESVGPVLASRDGVVGCWWLEAPAGGDEFHLAARQAPLGGDPALWGRTEFVTDQPMVVPQFRAAAGAVHADGLQAAWSDRRDFQTGGFNVYASERALAANLAPHAPEGWESPLVINLEPGVRATGPLAPGLTAYASLAVVNLGLTDAAGPFAVELRLDDDVVGSWTLADGLPLATFTTAEDVPLVLDAGAHVLSLRIDPAGRVAESDETDNRLDLEVWVPAGSPSLALDPPSLTFHAEAPVAAGAPRTVARGGGAGGDAPIIAPRLAAALARSAAGDRLRVVVAPDTRVDPAWLAAAPREEALAALRDHADAVRARLGAAVRAPLRALWLSGELVGELTPAAVADLAATPGVARLWLDDQLSRPLAAGARAASGPPLAGLIPDGHRASGAPRGALPQAVAPLAAAPLAASPQGAAPLAASPQGAAPLALASDRDVDPDAGRDAGRDASRDASRDAWPLLALRVPEARAAGLDGTGVLVGHTDSGVAWDHPDLAGRLWDGGAAYPHHGYDFLDEDLDPYDPGEGGFWHGTHTAGLVVGASTGAAPGARLLVTRCVPGYYEDLVEALQFCLDQGCHLVSTSAGWTDAGDALRSANRGNAEVMLAMGVPWLVAAGNGDNAGGHVPIPRDISSPGDAPDPWFAGGDPGDPDDPAVLDGRSAAITIGALTEAGGVWSSSSRGPTSWDVAGDAGHDDYPHPPGLTKPDLAAPGAAVVSTVGGGGYAAYSGTSMATPLVAGCAAMLLQANPALTPAELSRTLGETAVDLGLPGRDNDTGAGRVDVAAAAAALPSAQAAFVQLRNTGAVAWRMEAVDPGAPWLSVAPASGVVAPGDSLRLQVAWDAAGLPAGAHHADVVLTGSGGLDPLHLGVILMVGEVVAVPPTTPDAAVAPLVCYPNPFNPRTTLRFELATSGPVRLDLFDARGRRVRRLVDRHLAAGDHAVAWDGRDGRGRPCAAGVYLARLTSGAGVRTGRMMLVR